MSERQMHLAGDWTRGAERQEVLNPYSGEVIATVPRARTSDAERAVAAAVEGARQMRALPAHERAAILNRAAAIADERVEQLAQTIAAEAGKALAEARGEAGRAGHILRVSAHEGAAAAGEALSLDASPGGEGKLGFTLRQPCGVVVAITPFNYPLLLVLHKVGPALAAGNAVVLKPAEATPLTALMLCEILLEAGLPPLALSVITGSGSELGPALCADPRVRKISFTGSTPVGEAITRVAGVKRLSLELGATCPTLVLADADLEAAAAAIAVGGYVNAGQVCISVQRVLVQSAVHADFLDALVPRVAAIEAGDPLAASSTIGSLISEREAQRVERAIAEAVDEGARVLVGGERDGAVVSPAVVDGVAPSAPLSRDELFGPAVAVTPVADVDEAIRVANDSRYGLGAGVFTKDVTAAMRFVREVDAGALHVNWTPLWRADPMPYGGLKGSGIGKEGPRYAVEEMTELKTVVIHGLA
ncbi:MAG: aldehyde dehydrogenase family protein [Thermoleophilaceae bacterium]|nr:aldehyde dehydrogenase family protein [Thermoleophilaceae bacterium]